MPEFHGTIDDLKAGVEATGIEGEWSQRPNYCWKFSANDRGGLNWASTKGKIWFDGPDGPKKQLAEAVEALLGIGPPKANDNRTIFVVHGHDPVAREQLELVLFKLGLKPYVLQNTDGGGLTIIQNLEQMIGKNAQSSFGIVLLTPDDIGYAKKDGDAAAKPRARQNVILEMGMLLASLTRERVAILQQGFIAAHAHVVMIHTRNRPRKLTGGCSGFIRRSSRLCRWS